LNKLVADRFLEDEWVANCQAFIMAVSGIADDASWIIIIPDVADHPAEQCKDHKPLYALDPTAETNFHTA